ncbi:MAG: hypothetical protein V1738_02690 [Patescibacteria group bacterium]
MSLRSVTSSANGRPLIIANGFFPVPLPLSHIAAAYRSCGFSATVIPFDLRNKCDVLTYAKTIDQLARRLFAETGQAVDIVGLSMGGIAGLYAIKFLGTAAFVRTLVTIGSPFHGSPVAAWAMMSPLFQLAARQMSPGSALLKKLELAPLPEEVRFVSLGGLFDLVSPVPTTKATDAENHYWCFSHYDLMFMSWLHLQVARLILL